MAAYITETEIREEMGGGVVDEIKALAGLNLDKRIARATAYVQSKLRNSGYATPDTTTSDVVKNATLAAFWQMASATPELSLALPEEWATHPLRESLDGIITGETQLDHPDHPLNTRSAVGGWGARPTTTEAPRRASRKDLEVY